MVLPSHPHRHPMGGAYTPGVTDERTTAASPLRVVGLVAGLVFLLVMVVYGFGAVEIDRESFVPGWLALLVGLAATTLCIIMLEFRVLARITGVSVSAKQAFSVTVIGAAANLLPIPGSAITRYVVLQRSGVAASVITTTLLGGALMWLGVAAGFAALGLTAGSTVIGALFGLGAIGVFGVGTFMLRRAGGSGRDTTLLALTELGITVVGIARFLTAAAMLSLPGSLRETVALAAAGPASAAVGIVPAGLGIRESLAAALGAISGLGGAEAAVIAVVDRAVGLAILVPAYVVIVVFGFRSNTEAA